MLCLLCPTPDHQRPRGGGSDFESLFGDFVRSRDDLWWVVTGGSYSPWNLPPEWSGDDEAMAVFDDQFATLPDGEHVACNQTVFSGAMKYLSDFWLEVYAFRQR